MATFPALKTGAVAQYPADRTRQHSTRVYRFVDGSEQRFPQFGAELRKWTVLLELLDEKELTDLEEFFSEQNGRTGQFSFTDPWDNTVHASCSFENDAFSAEFRDSGRGAAAVVIRENR